MTILTLAWLNRLSLKLCLINLADYLSQLLIKLGKKEGQLACYPTLPTIMLLK